MKLINYITINPKRLRPKQMFSRSTKDRSMVSRSDPSSFSSELASSSDSSLKKANAGATTPTSVLGAQRSGDWSCENQLLQAIRLIDRDNDGMVSRGELETLLSRLGAEPPSREEVSTMVSEVVHERDGEVSVEELTNRIGSAWGEGPAGDDELREVFLFFDADRDGRITDEELLRFFTALGDEPCTLEECRSMIAAVDQNGDGVVCFEDFSLMMDLRR